MSTTETIPAANAVNIEAVAGLAAKIHDSPEIAALGNCLAVGYAASATAAGVEINELRIELEGDLDLHTFLGLDPAGNAGYQAIRSQAIRSKVTLDADAPSETIEELHRLVTGTSPVGHTLARSVPIQVDLA